MYAFSKAWFKCYNVNLGCSDIDGINSAVKRWLYADMIIKPEKLVLYRPLYKGGLGLVSVKQKAKACFLRNFLELSSNPKYIQSL